MTAFYRDLLDEFIIRNVSMEKERFYSSLFKIKIIAPNFRSGNT